MSESQTKPVVQVSRVVPAAPQEVFDAWTDPESLKIWFRPAGNMTIPVAELDLRVGGQYRIVMRGDEGDYDHTGEYVEIVPNERLVFTWHSPATGGARSLVTVTMRPVEDGTEVAILHEDLPTAEVAERHTGGWTHILDCLADDAAAD